MAPRVGRIQVTSGQDRTFWNDRLFFLACENSRFSLFLAAWDVSLGETSVPQRQKLRNDDVNQCLHNQFGSLGVGRKFVRFYVSPGRYW